VFGYIVLWLALGDRRRLGRRLIVRFRGRRRGLLPIGVSGGRLYLSRFCLRFLGERSILRLLGSRLFHGRRRERFFGKRLGFGYILRLWLWLEGRCCRRLLIGRSDGRLDDGLHRGRLLGERRGLGCVLRRLQLWL